MQHDTTHHQTPGANLREASLKGATLTWARVGGAVLESADLTGATCRDADLTGARLAGATLARADLARAGLGTADMTRADLTGAVLDHARWEGRRRRMEGDGESVRRRARARDGGARAHNQCWTTARGAAAGRLFGPGLARRWPVRLKGALWDRRLPTAARGIGCAASPPIDR